MLRAGKANWIVIVGLVGVVVMIAVFLAGGESPTTAVNRFMAALAKGDVSTLADMTYMPDKDPAAVRAEWERATQVVGPYYRFRWQTLSQSVPDEKSAAVQLFVWRNATDPGTYEEKYGIPLVKVDGKWKVQVRGIPRSMYPGLPR